MRAALRSAATHGYFVFDELLTDKAGMIDFLAIGPVGACVVVVRDEEGEVTADADGKLYLNGRPFPDDPYRQAEDLADDMKAKIEDTSAHPYHIVCFTRAELYYLGDEPEVLTGVSPVWDLALPFASAEAACTPADVAELADRVRAAYGRPPFVIPEEGGR